MIQKQDLFNLKDLGDVLHFLEAVVRRDPVSSTYISHNRH